MERAGVETRTPDARATSVCRHGDHELTELWNFQFTFRFQESMPGTGSNDAVISSSFNALQDNEGGLKGHFVINLGHMSKRLRKYSVRLEGLADFAANIEKYDHLIVLDLENGYFCLRLPLRG